MSKARWTSDDMKKAGMIETENGFVKADKLVDKGKVEKLPNLIINTKSLKGLTKSPQDIFRILREEGSLLMNSVFLNKIYIKIKPLSVNTVWKGKRFKTPQYKQYALAVSLMLPNDLIVPEGLLRVYYEFGLSSNGGDWDNPVKPFQDILQEKYGFNDSRIMEATVKKVIVKKGQEYISFRIDQL